MRGNLPGAPRENRKDSLMMPVWNYNLSTMEYNLPAGIHVQGMAIVAAYPGEEVCACQEWHGKVRLAASPVRGGYAKHKMFRVSGSTKGLYSRRTTAQRLPILDRSSEGEVRISLGRDPSTCRALLDRAAGRLASSV